MTGKPTHGLSYRHEYRVWQTMRLRCLDTEHPAYPNYGGRGITICDRWRDSVRAFVEDMGPRPTATHEIDRRDNDRGYEPGNCRWATRAENCRNRRSNRRLTHEGLTLPLAEWCERLRIPSDTVRKRLEAGWPTDRALTTPVRPKAPAARVRPAAQAVPMPLFAAE